MYALMTEGKSKAEVAEFDALIADPAEKEAMIARQNQLAQEEIARRMGMILAPPQPRPPTPKRNGTTNGKPVQDPGPAGER